MPVGNLIVKMNLDYSNTRGKICLEKLWIQDQLQQLQIVIM